MHDNLPAIPDEAVRLHEPVSVRMRPSAFRADVKMASVLSGMNILEALRHAVRQSSVPVGIIRTAVVFVNGKRIPREDWCSTLLREGDLVSVSVPLMGGGGGGGKNPLRTILSLVVIAVAAIATWYVGGTGAYFGVTALGWGQAAGAIAGAVVMMGGMLLVNAICPASMPKLSLGMGGDSEASAKIWSIDGAQNKADPYGPVPTVLGKIRWAPRFASQPYSVLSGNDQYVRYLYVCSTGDCVVTEPRIGDTALDKFQGCEWNVYRNWTGQKTKWFEQSATEENLGIEMKQSIGWQTRTTARDTTRVTVVIVFEGLKYINDRGDASSVSVDVGLRYRPTGTGDDAWIDTSAPIVFTNKSATFNVAEGNFSIGVDGGGNLVYNGGWTIAYGRQTRRRYYDWDEYGNDTGYWEINTVITSYASGFTGTVTAEDIGFSGWPPRLGNVKFIASGTKITGVHRFSGCTINPQRRAITFDVPEGQYDISMRRVTPDSDDESTKSTRRDAFTWTLLQSWRDFPAVVGDETHPLTIMEVQIKATEQLNGHLDELNVLCSSTAPCWDVDAEQWSDQETSNPSSLALRIATGYDIGKPAKMEEMDLDAFAGFYQWCERMGWKYNALITSRSQAGEPFHNVCSAGRGSYALLNGHGVIWDDPDAPVVDMLTQRNSWGFSAQKALLIEEVHGLRMRFLNEQKDFQEDERIVYADGYDESNASNVIEWEQDGVTDPDLIWKHGRLRLAEMRLRPEVYTLNCEAESLTLRRGDRIRCLHDVTFWGITNGVICRVIKSADGRITGIELDEYCPMDANKAYGVRITNSLLTDAYYSVETAPGETRELRFQAALDPAITGISEGDIVGFGISSSVGAMLTVLSVTPQEGFSAQVTLCDAAPEIYDALTGQIPPWNSQITIPNRYQAGKPRAPEIIGIVSDETVLYVAADGTLKPSMQVTCGIPDQPAGVRAFSLAVYVRPVGSEEAWEYFTTIINGETATITDSNVQEGQAYDVRAQIATSTGIVSDWSETVQHTVIGKTSPPPDVTGLALTIEAPSGIRASWDGVRVLDFDHYELTGPGGGKTVDTSLVCPVPGQTGVLDYAVVAVDTGGRVSETPATASVEILPPEAPAGFEADTRNDGLYLVWDDCDTTWPVRHYIITDEYLSKTSKELRTQTVISPRAVGSYGINVQPVDIFDNLGPRVSHELVVQQPSTPVVTTEINNGVVRLTWPAVASSFPVKTYQVYSVNGQLLQETAATFYDVTGPSGTLEYRIRAVDSAGNMSAFAEVVLELTAPDAPVVTVALNDTRDGLVINWSVPDAMLPVLTYDVVRQWEEDRGDGVVELHEQDYGSTDATTLSVPAIPAGRHVFMVRAVDASGARSVWDTSELDVTAPQGTLAPVASVIDNNVMLYWQAPTKQFFAIDHYDLYTVEDGIPVYDGRIDALFASRFELAAGEYTYQLCPVDKAGNVGQCSRITARVSQPPDFVLFDERDSVFSGTLANAVLDGRGSMILPVPAGETWAQNIQRVAGLLSVSGDTLTWRQKVDGGYPAWLSPAATQGGYTEIVDVGAIIPSTSITVTVSSTVLEGDPQLSCKIEVSETGADDDWRVMAENALFTFATQFRFVRYTFEVSGGMLAISNINYRLDVKKLSDFGSVFSAATDNGEGFVDKETTPDLYGTWVPFAVSFVDVQAGPFVSCGEEGKTAYINFQDVQEPEGFRVFVLDVNGQRVDGQVSWSVNGV
ncbi:TipJ family phage tail tip protein [Desulfovibrio piger]|uniref:TipJ family phage tail tip protein n=1 Tax=Desulfovibrio piger TaxID=901 RepID=UPI0026F12C47|nr:hypothetical protein [Desulfovibrio piger]